MGLRVRCQKLQHGVRRVVAVGDALAVKAVAGLAILDLHHGQRGGAGAALRAGLHAVGRELRAQFLAEAVGGQGVEVMHRGTAQTGRARHVVRATAPQGAQLPIGLGDAVHQGFAEDKNVFFHDGSEKMGLIQPHVFG